MPGIFICYRRGDSAGFAGRLYDRLVSEFGPDLVFMDVDANIPGGEDFVEFIDKRVRDCDALIALMGKRWLTSRKGRKRRLDDLLDFVRLEIQTALKQRVRVVPVLLEGASAVELPERARLFRLDNLKSQGYRTGTTAEFRFKGRSFHPGKDSHWKCTLDGLERLAQLGRLAIEGNNLSYVRFIKDFPAVQVGNAWTDVGGIQSRSDPRIICSAN